MYLSYFRKYSPGRHKYGRGFVFNYKTYTFILGIKFQIKRKKLFPKTQITWIYKNINKEKLYKDFAKKVWRSKKKFVS
tara:strand:+ start:290 stop:523 length:234 start_codon:yes stop_codon:yes gene_type:complete